MKTLLSQCKIRTFEMGNIQEWLGRNWVEIVAALVSITYVILAIRQVIWTWIFGILSAALYAWVYADSGFYAGMVLQGYYVAVSIYGWIHWSLKTGKDQDGGKPGLPVSRLKTRLLIVLVLVWLFLWILFATILDHFTDSTIPYWDAFTTAGGAVATWMIARKILEQWFFWIVVDSISIGLYIWQGLYVTSALFVLYIIMAIYGYREWKADWRKSQ